MSNVSQASTSIYDEEIEEATLSSSNFELFREKIVNLERENKRLRSENASLKSENWVLKTSGNNASFNHLSEKLKIAGEKMVVLDREKDKARTRFTKMFVQRNAACKAARYFAKGMRKNFTDYKQFKAMAFENNMNALVWEFRARKKNKEVLRIQQQNNSSIVDLSTGSVEDSMCKCGRDKAKLNGTKKEKLQRRINEHKGPEPMKWCEECGRILSQPV